MVYPESYIQFKQKKKVWREIPFSLLAVVALLRLCNDAIFNGTESILTRSDGMILLLFFITFLVYSYGVPKNEIRDKPDIKILSGWKISLFVLLGLIGLFFGGNFVRENAVKLAVQLNLSEKLIGLTFLAIGTTLLELSTSAIAAYKKKSDIAIGNIVGSNIFNIFLILGITSVIRPLPFNAV